MNLENLNVTELDAQEKLGVEGGNWRTIGGALFWFVFETIDNWDECMASYKESFNETANTQCSN